MIEIENFKKIYDYQNDSEIAKFLDLSASAFSQIKKRNSVFTFLQKITEKIQNPVFLLNYKIFLNTKKLFNSYHEEDVYRWIIAPYDLIFNEKIKRFLYFTSRD